MSTVKKENGQIDLAGLLDIGAVKVEAASFVVAHINDMDKSDKMMADSELNQLHAAIKMGLALNSAKAVFKANKFSVETDFFPWAEDFIGRKKATIKKYIKLANHKDEIAHATGIEHADHMIAGRAPIDGSEPEPKEKTPLSDEKRLANIIAQLEKVTDVNTIAPVIRKKLSDMLKKK